ncbi:MAG: hypothetical protein Kow002_21700 [Anaerolineales bacterium]
MISRRVYFVLAACLVLGLAVYACGGAPLAGAPGAEEPSVPEPTQPPALTALPPATPTLSLPDAGGGDPGPSPVIQENRRLTLAYAPSIRVGDSTRIRMTLEVDDLGNLTPTAVVEGNVIKGETVQIPNLYETHLVVAEARLDMAGVQVAPSNTISEGLQPGKSVTFYWTVRPPEAGKYEGTAWLHLRFIPMTTLNDEHESRIAVSAQFITLEARSLFGLSGGTARGVGAAGSVVGAVIGFPFFDDFVKWLWRRLRAKKA